MNIKRVALIILTLTLGVYALGCKKKVAQEELPEPLSMEALTAIPSGETTPVAEVKTQEPKATVVESKPQAAQVLEALPPAGPYKPTAAEIQAALKNAGFYTGEIDGKIGPLSRKATEEFQKANNLVVDGKVGPKTWAALSKYLNKK